MNIVPYPKKIIEDRITVSYRSVKSKPYINDLRLERALDNLPYSSDGAELRIDIVDGSGEGYTLKLEENAVLINAQSAVGAFYAIQTLRQIFENETIVCAVIEDEPDFAVRGFYHDVTRGKIPTVETLKKLIDKMAYYKLNSLQLYVEHTFEFKEYNDSLQRTGYLTSEELKELDRYCSERFVEFIPSLSTFGHLFELLEKDRYEHLRETEAPDVIAWDNRMAHHTIDPTKIESFELVKSLIDQYIPCFSSDKFNICCDETFDLKIGRHKHMDTTKLYVDFVCKIIEYVKSKGKTVMMWADILLQHPDTINSIPEDTILLNWDYESNVTDWKVRKIAEMGRKQIVCPGTWTWAKLCENTRNATQNIIHMANYGKECGAVGVLNTNWGDWGNPCSLELSMHGFVVGAERSWNSSADDNYRERINDVTYKNQRMSEYLTRLTNIQDVTDWKTLASVYSNMISSDKITVEYPTREKLENAIHESFVLIDDVTADTWEKSEYKNELIIAAYGSAVIGELLLKSGGYNITRKTDTSKWLKAYSDMWRQKNKEGELCEIQKMFETLENNLD